MDGLGFLLGIMWFGPPVVSWLKGKYGLALVGIFVPLAGWIGSLMLAKPDSWWAVKYYKGSGTARGREQMMLAKRRYPTF